MFGVSNDFFPEYDEGNLYNTNPNFDYGAFKDLAEKHRLMKSNSTLFSFKFTVPGVYAFKLSSNINSKMVSVDEFSKPKICACCLCIRNSYS